LCQTVSIKKSSKKNNKKAITEKYGQNKIRKKHNIHQHDTDDGGQAMGGELMHVQMSR